jgi:glycosyltransferase involved in cell wall biosynthesis
VNRKIRIAYVVSHPIQYQAPLLRLLARQPDIEFKAFFFDQTTAGPYIDTGFNQTIEWDVPLLDGYPNETLSDSKGLGGIWHRNVEERLCSGDFHIIWVHGHNHPTLFRIIRAARQRGIKVLMRGDSHPFITHPNPIRRSMREMVLKWCFPQCSAFLCIGTRNRQFYLERGVGEEKLFETPYAVDNDFFQKRAALARPKREGLRNSLGLQSGRPIILFAGKLQDHKGPMDLLEAYIRMSPDSRTEPTPYLLFAGSGSRQAQLEQRAKSTGFNSIRFTGFQNQTQLPALFDLCDLFVLPSRREPWGLVVNEAMNAAKPVVVSDVAGCAPDLVSDENGWIFRAGDVNSLREVLSTALADVKRLEAMGNRSLDRIGRYTYQKDVQGLMTAADWALCQSTSPLHRSHLLSNSSFGLEQ